MPPAGLSTPTEGAATANEEERERFNELAAQVAVLHFAVVDLCRRNFTMAEIDDFIERLGADVRRSWNPELIEKFGHATRAFRQDIERPIMDC